MLPDWFYWLVSIVGLLLAFALHLKYRRLDRE